MRIISRPIDLRLKYPFSISGFSRVSTPVMLIEIEHEGLVGFGEASLVPYMGESIETASAFLSRLDLSWWAKSFDFEELLVYLDSLDVGNPAIKAAVDIALHDLKGKLEGVPCYSFFNSNPAAMPVTAITIGIDTSEVIMQKVTEADAAQVLKVKLGSENDRKLIETIRTVTTKPLYADANQGWHDQYEAIDMLHWLKEQGVEIVEQPMLKSDLKGNAWVTERSPIPVLADESFQRLSDLDKLEGAYHGINVKLMKSAGMHEAFKMILRARELNMKVLIGCMSETSVATLAGAALAPLCDWADLDGPFLTLNNPYSTPDFKNGRWVLSATPGLGVLANAG